MNNKCLITEEQYFAYSLDETHAVAYHHGHCLYLSGVEVRQDRVPFNDEWVWSGITPSPAVYPHIVLKYAKAIGRHRRSVGGAVFERMKQYIS